jgi:hypothetical protein
LKGGVKMNHAIKNRAWPEWVGISSAHNLILGKLLPGCTWADEISSPGMQLNM